MRKETIENNFFIRNKDKDFQKDINKLLANVKKFEPSERYLAAFNILKCRDSRIKCMLEDILNGSIIDNYDEYDILKFKSVLKSTMENYPDCYGKFFVIEGTDGIGKSTALECFDDTMFRVTREPGGTEVAEKIRNILLDGNLERMEDKTELLLFYASRNEHLEKLIIPMRQAGVNIVSSRFYDSSYAYQYAGRGMAIEKLDWLTDFVCTDNELSYPTLIISMYLESIKTSTKRMEGRKLDRIEADGEDFLAKTNEFFRTLKSYSDRILNRTKDPVDYLDAVDKYKHLRYDVFHVNAERSIIEVQTDIKKKVSEYMR